MEERLQKILAKAGFGSRRANEELIEAGRVRVNGKVASLGMKADPERDAILVDMKPIPKAQTERIYIALHKPRGVLSDVDPNDERQTVRDLVPVPGHLFAVGRLDYDSEGLILLTNDGDLANRLTHPRYGHEKEYRVLISKKPDDEQLTTWRRGVVLEDGYKTAPAQVSVESTAARGIWLRVILREGRKRQIREVGSRIGLPVSRIVRIRIGNLPLGSLKPKEWRNLTMDEVKKLRTLSETPSKSSARPRSFVRARQTTRTSQTGRGGGWRQRPSESGRIVSRQPRPDRSPGSYPKPGGPTVWSDEPRDFERDENTPRRSEPQAESGASGREVRREGEPREYQRKPSRQTPARKSDNRSTDASSKSGGRTRPSGPRRPKTGGRPSSRNKPASKNRRK
jgi:23S rRNA pseudouridine2605 synthase